jgi:hypothetical protein
MSVHDDDVCGEDFSDLAKSLTSSIREKKLVAAMAQLQRCKEARLDAAVHHGNMNDAHIIPYNLIQQLQYCLVEINKTIKFAEVYKGGRTTISFYMTPMRFTVSLSVKKGTRVYTVKSSDYDYVDIPL